ncbi:MULTISPECIES: bifunctional adenosylcobinamide kinase/adenosylcobinamide-phosphate guanylyltransferase [Dethiosulfovibrio]|uniref:Adenosylcobinamide kinase n=2 Tax=Dethiosulfovibrio TaxID=47054 RepID=A0ABS9EJA6_9BACT|nr:MULTISPECIES: bifunctional adenosylcobinamide kinase/adenosylcobinamide-phosphate guanylyltransferase [Dethiosulfovibrio]MCF4112827.1 bifunctional adenosylcobinamide kinase/adenosylcobinamide-phosphate guanylyltransferase [Dethiosulfovibrio russensis]MCF4141291.1 bifunctional adenosylcobinamide kinase/adenosylcobinamide-phosphate guanylyltransferase [Dethiosulfovibrio marinus]MCF4144977.1 bifunctional adenosylcobinamide kinase/adenosylcobinamide-phosphate guanylyltransferase [Dethiosulfovibri
MGNIVLVLGGARSGKSGFAQSLISDQERHCLRTSVFYVATAGIEDDEMARRVARHRADRPDRWKTLEAQNDVVGTLEEIPSKSIVLLDCVTMMVTNLMFSRRTEWDGLSMEDERSVEQFVLGEVDRMLEVFRRRDISAVLVSNEVGQGLVPPYPLGRIFRDIAGWANQRIAKEADSVYLITAGIPQIIKEATS